MGELIKNNIIQNKSFIVLCCCGMLFNLSFTILAPIMPSYFGIFGVGTIAISYIFSFYGFGRTALQIPAGIIADLWGYKKILLLALAMLGILFYIQTLFIQPVAIAIIYILEGFMIGIITPLMYSVVGILVNDTQKGKGIGTYNIFSCLGSAAGPLIGGALISKYSNYNIAFILAAIAAFGGFISIIQIDEVKISKKEKQHLSIKKERQKPYQILSSIIGLEFIMLGCLSMLGDFICSSLTAIFPIYGDSVLKMPLTYISFILSLNFLVFSFSGPFVGKICDKIGSKKQIIISLIVEIIAFILLRYISNPYLFIGIILIEFLAGSAIYIALQSQLVDYGAKTENRGLIYGIIGTLQGLGLVIGPIFSGYVYEYNHSYYFIGMAIPCCLALFLFVIMAIKKL